MAKISKIEPLVEKALRESKNCRKDDFLLYLTVISNFLDTGISIKTALVNHNILGLPSFETITRCRRKLQERDITLKDENMAVIREREQEDYKEYALADKVWY